MTANHIRSGLHGVDLSKVYLKKPDIPFGTNRRIMCDDVETTTAVGAVGSQVAGREGVPHNFGLAVFVKT